MKHVLTFIFILISVSLFSQWTVRTDTLISNLNDTIIEEWVGLQTPHPKGMLLQLKLDKYYINEGVPVLVASNQYKVNRRNYDTINEGGQTALWLKDQTFVNRNFIKMWAEIEIEKILYELRKVPIEE